METRGALLWEPGTDSGWSVEEIQIDLFTSAMSGKRLPGTLYGTTGARNDIHC